MIPGEGSKHHEGSTSNYPGVLVTQAIDNRDMTVKAKGVHLVTSEASGT
jgi:hypothetical protein